MGSGHPERQSAPFAHPRRGGGAVRVRLHGGEGPYPGEPLLPNPSEPAARAAPHLDGGSP
ncbi:hypothetical protein DYH09_25105 [bacterium CPR1]|nr:hypothetical protein [bacterium CPR1]